MRKTYRVYYIDNNGFHNQKLLEANNIVDVCNYMFNNGYVAHKIEEVKE